MHRFFAILLKEKSIQNKKKVRNLSTALNMTRQTTRHKTSKKQRSFGQKDSLYFSPSRTRRTNSSARMNTSLVNISNEGSGWRAGEEVYSAENYLIIHIPNKNNNIRKHKSINQSIYYYYYYCLHRLILNIHLIL